jgi:hypothetical protein
MLAWALALAVVIVVVNTYAIVFPKSLRNRESFIGGLAAPLTHPSLLCGLAASALLALAVFVERRGLAALAVIAAGVSIVLPLLGYTSSAYVSFASRTLTGTLLPVLLLVATLAAWRARGRFVPDERWARALTAAFVLYLLGNAVSWSEWTRFRADFERVLASEHGYVAIEDTSLHADDQRWGWTSPLLSVLWSGGCVRTVVLNKTGVVWEPFDPRSHLPLQEHFAFTRDFHAAAARARTCE